MGDLALGQTQTFSLETGQHASIDFLQIDRSVLVWSEAEDDRDRYGTDRQAAKTDTFRE